jgi:hypothetical protein
VKNTIQNAVSAGKNQRDRGDLAEVVEEDIGSRGDQPGAEIWKPGARMVMRVRSDSFGENVELWQQMHIVGLERLGFI